MNEKIALRVSGIIFALIALAHLIRILYHANIIVSGHIVPMELSYIGFVVALVLSIWVFGASRK